MISHFNTIMISLTLTMLLMLVYVLYEGNFLNSQEQSQDKFSAYHMGKMPELQYYENYEELVPNTKAVVVYPIFTQSAYEWKGFHDFYTGYCETCLTAQIQNYYEKKLASSGNGFRILEFLGYETINDIDLDKNPDILEQYDKVILLHNEFVTRTEFEAITNHPNVIYLYPNALSSEIKVNYSNNTMTLVSGPGYPTPNITNGFLWKFDNSKYFEDWDCNNWKFYPVENGYMLNCYPETQLPKIGDEILRTLKTL